MEKGEENTRKRYDSKYYLLKNPESYKYGVYEMVNDLYEKNRKNSERLKDIKTNPYHVNIIKKKDTEINNLKEDINNLRDIIQSLTQ